MEKEFFNLIEISEVVNLKYRQIQNRFKPIKAKYENRKELIFKSKNVWFIHNSILSEFKRERAPLDYKLFTTISSKNRFENEYWKFLVKDLNKKLKLIEPNCRTKYVIESTKRKIPHLHFITTFSQQKLLRKLINENIITNKSNQMNQNIQEIFDVKRLHSYLKKQNNPILLN